MSVTIDYTTKVISIPKTYMSLDTSDPYDIYIFEANQFHLDLRAEEVTEQGIINLPTHNHTTIVTLGGTTFARLVEIINGYTLTFEDGSYAVSIEGANTNFADVLNLNQVSVRTANTAGLIQIAGGGESAADIADAVWEEAQADHISAGTMGKSLSDAAAGGGGGSIDISEVQALIESQRGYHTGTGNLYFVDPVNGDTFANGADGSKSNPFDSVQDCHDNAVTDSNHDIVFLLPGAAAGVTTLDEVVTLTKRYTFYRGPGRDFIWKRTSVGNVITVTGDGMEFTGFQVETHTLGVGHAFSITGADFTRIHNVWFNETRGDGINASGCSNTQIHDNTFVHTGQGASGQAIQIDSAASTADHNVIRQNHFGDIAGHALYLTGNNVNHTIIEGNAIHDCTGYGINIQSATVADSFIRLNVLGNNTLGDINDSGTNTIAVNNEQWATIQETVDAVWDELLSEHQIVGSTGESLYIAGKMAPEGGWMSSSTAAEIKLVRDKLGDAGNLIAETIVDEESIASSADTVFTMYHMIFEVNGVWLKTDTDHTGTNYYIGANGTFDSHAGMITLHTTLPSDNEEVIISYTYFKGLHDDVITQFLTEAKMYVKKYTRKTYDWSLAFAEPADEETQIALWAAAALAAKRCLEALAAGDILQLGFNFRLGDLEIENMVRGGGFQVQAHIDMLNEDVNNKLAMLGRGMYFSAASTKRFGRDHWGYRRTGVSKPTRGTTRRSDVT